MDDMKSTGSEKEIAMLLRGSISSLWIRCVDVVISLSQLTTLGDTCVLLRLVSLFGKSCGPELLIAALSCDEIFAPADVDERDFRLAILVARGSCLSVFMAVVGPFCTSDDSATLTSSDFVLKDVLCCCSFRRRLSLTSCESTTQLSLG